MRDITEKIAKAKDFLIRGSEDYAILSIIEILEILAMPEPDTATIETRCGQACPHCENGMITPLAWVQCDAAMKIAGTHNIDAYLAWFNANSGGYATFDDLPDEEVECNYCGGTGTIEIVAPIHTKFLRDVGLNRERVDIVAKKYTDGVSLTVEHSALTLFLSNEQIVIIAEMAGVEEEK